MNDPHFIQNVQTNEIPQPTLLQKSNDDSLLKDQYGQVHARQLTFHVPNSYHYKYSFPIEVEKNTKDEEHEKNCKKN